MQRSVKVIEKQTNWENREQEEISSTEAYDMEAVPPGLQSLEGQKLVLAMPVTQVVNKIHIS